MASDQASILSCTLCGKTFDRSSTLKRHGYYCRTRNGVQPPRARACVSCVSTKTRCDNARPACSRCNAKGLPCRYPARAIRAAEMRGARVPSTTEQKKPAPAFDPMPASVAQTSALLHLASDIDGVAYDPTLSSWPPQETLGFDPGFGAWDDIDWQFLLSDAGPYSSSFSPTTGPDSETPSSSSDNRLGPQSVTTAPESQIPRLPTLDMPSILRRQHADAGAQRVSQIILQTLKSYPLMMMRQKTPPPFLHPSLLATSATDGAADDTTESLEPWHNCMSLVYMANSKIKGSRRLFWRNVQAECERFCQRHFELDRWELLATMQALAIYVIMRIDETPEENQQEAKIDGLLLRAVTVIAIQFLAVDFRSGSCSTPYTAWKNWILEESGRRLCVLFKVISMLVSFEPAKMCKAVGDVILAPLPAQKQLWEAPDHNIWKRDGETESGAQMEFGLTKNGQLVRLGGDAEATAAITGDDIAAPPSTIEWNEWCSGMDGIGNLVMLAASMMQQF
ncbi:hypothetical protein P170DRAFT_436070 [Aspergillus steynii IBT 23096]|uniref:Zn(2)-C6 fungal-type domain-containing protein n=1 Tax=Aspergillus steynii IBT 23096 TaxID=1392250 RepID=A0A2I2GDP8_9EURO|nr:uncharacterized protein P170DRAFT_436070 [Aspergillus steynii IBT 23096]PLB50990.1 hypothetical protein P170DRAFT_436070 [Aspergillus steynii IBT 23096]